MQVTINVPTPVVRTYVTAQFLAYNAPAILASPYHNIKWNRQQKKAAKKAAEHDVYIAQAQANIGPYVPVSYTQVWA